MKRVSSPEHDPVAKIAMRMLRVIESYQKENYALRDMLRQRGLTPRQIRTEMNVLLKHPKSQSRADLQFRELRQGMKGFLRENQESLERLAKIPVFGKPQ